jgi:hypothetical protein
MCWVPRQVIFHLLEGLGAYLLGVGMLVPGGKVVGCRIAKSVGPSGVGHMLVKPANLGCRRLFGPGLKQHVVPALTVGHQGWIHHKNGFKTHAFGPRGSG